jgi:CheY-like chemotaxis protein
MIRSAAHEYELVRAYSGAEGLLKMRRQRPDLILLDLIMPEMDGYEVLAQMREDAELRNIPVVVITAHGRTPEEERRLGGGMLSVISGTGFSNEEALRYLRGFLTAIPAPPVSEIDKIRAGDSSPALTR